MSHQKRVIIISHHFIIYLTRNFFSLTLVNVSSGFDISRVIWKQREALFSFLLLLTLLTRFLLLVVTNKLEHRTSSSNLSSSRYVSEYSVGIIISPKV